MKIFIRAIALVILFVVGAVAYGYYGLTHRPDIGAYRSLQSLPAPATGGDLRVTFAGVSTLLFDDGETAILTDGFFTRPAARQVFLEKISPDKAVIGKMLARAGITKLATVIVNHSHYDHAMDSPEVAARTGAVLVGSDSTANIGRGWGLPENRIAIRHAGDVMSFGRFRITLLQGEHVPSPFTGGQIDAPLKPPVRTKDYLEGGSFAVLIEHGDRRILVNASAGFAPGAVKGRKADVVFLGVGQLGKRPASYMNDYWQEMVETPGARRVIPIHWDDFTRSLDEPLVPLPYLVDDFSATMTFLAERSRSAGIDLKLPVAFEPFDPFAGLTLDRK